MTGNDFLSFAEWLCRDPRTHNEALCRTIVSRAYYGVFHLSRDYVTRLGFPETDKHRFLSELLVASGESSVMRAGDLLRDLATARGRADYELAKPSVMKQVQDFAYLRQIIEQASAIKELLDRAATEQAQATAKQGIAAFWKTQGHR